MIHATTLALKSTAEGLRTFTDAERALPAVVRDAFELARKSRDVAELMSTILTSSFQAGLRHLTSGERGSALESVAGSIGLSQSNWSLGQSVQQAVRQATIHALGYGLLAGALDGAASWALSDFPPDPSLKRLEGLSAEELRAVARAAIDTAFVRAETQPTDLDVGCGIMSQTDYRQALQEHYEYGYTLGTAGAQLHHRGLLGTLA